MMEIELTNAEAVELAKRWGAKDFVTPDEILDAYKAGKERGIIGYAESLKKKRQEALLASMRASSEIIVYLDQQLKINVEIAFLRQLLISDEECVHKTLIVINKKNYLSEIAKEAYSILIDKSRKIRSSKGLIIDFALMPNEELNKDLLLGDGYIYHYVKESSRA